MYEEDDYLMLSGLQHFMYCRRQWALIHIEQQWEEKWECVGRGGGWGLGTFDYERTSYKISKIRYVWYL